MTERLTYRRTGNLEAACQRLLVEPVARLQDAVQDVVLEQPDETVCRKPGLFLTVDDFAQCRLLDLSYSDARCILARFDASAVHIVIQDYCFTVITRHML